MILISNVISQHCRPDCGIPLKHMVDHNHFGNVADRSSFNEDELKKSFEGGFLERADDERMGSGAYRMGYLRG
jgi:hypothetical protein